MSLSATIEPWICLVPSPSSPVPPFGGPPPPRSPRGWPPSDLSERVNATPETIRDHYDHPELLRRMESRRENFDDTEEQ